MENNTNKTKKRRQKKHINNHFKTLKDIVNEISKDNKPLFYFYCVCLFSDERIIAQILTTFFDNYKTNNPYNIYNARAIIMNVIFKQEQIHRKSLDDAFHFFKYYIYPSIEYFKFAKDEPLQIANLLTEILYITFTTKRVYYWQNHCLFEVTFQNGLFTEDDVVSERYNIEIINTKYLVIEGHNKKIRYDKFVDCHPKSRVSDFERYMNFYQSLVTTLFPKKGTYCGICRPYGKKPINPNTGKTITSHPCQKCKKIFNSIYNLLNHDAEAIGRIKDNITKIRYNANDTSYINKRVEAFQRSFDREILKHKLDKDTLKNSVSEQEFKKIFEKINSIKETMILQIEKTSSEK